MNVSQLFTDDDAVSSVLGVLILVVISLTLALTIGIFVFNSSEEISDEKPEAEFEFEFEFDSDASTPMLTIRHESGEPVPADQLTVTVDQTNVSLSPAYEFDQSFSGTVETGATAVVTKGSAGSTWEGETVQVVWTAESGTETAVLGEITAPKAAGESAA
ncbi:type IV pilin [Haloferax larsenii]|uniref:Flagellin (Archaellin), FlaG/FlaF family n=1 Tax=Haloferax larsenii TaxID=302484 RepID=A0A1H7PLH2_HALLR|nr:type IV pilin N-terminal domain-containing protein [Haloferax larsenii]SEL36328.1 flagellin (archaellin), FlaG/FlaF family [Haloferax larsenii]